MREAKKWKLVREEWPPVGLVVETKIDDGEGVRNVQPLKFGGRLWFTPDRATYVYYEPTH